MLEEANNLRSLSKSQTTLHSLPVPDIGQEEVGKTSLFKAMIADCQPLFRDALGALFREIMIANMSSRHSAWKTPWKS